MFWIWMKRMIMALILWERSIGSTERVLLIENVFLASLKNQKCFYEKINDLDWTFNSLVSVCVYVFLSMAIIWLAAVKSAAPLATALTTNFSTCIPKKTYILCFIKRIELASLQFRHCKPLVLNICDSFALLSMIGQLFFSLSTVDELEF